MTEHVRLETRYQLYQASAPFSYYSIEIKENKKKSLLKYLINRRLQNDPLMIEQTLYDGCFFKPGKHFFFKEDKDNDFINRRKFKDPRKIIKRFDPPVWYGFKKDFVKRKNQYDRMMILERFNTPLQHGWMRDVNTLSEVFGTLYARTIRRFMERSIPEYIFKSKPDVIARDVTELCRKENELITKRKKFVLDNIKKTYRLDNSSHEEEHVPTIAIIGSGGGLRAVIGMCGAMTALKTAGVLDSTMYTAGVSGSSWYLLAMFANDMQGDPKALYGMIRKRLQHFSTLKFWEMLNGWANKSKIVRNYFSISDSLGEMIGGMLLEDKHRDQSWSTQSSKLVDGHFPLPLVSALHIRDEKTIKDYHEWVEFSPFEVYIPKYGAAIDMKNFGDEFYRGYVIQRNGETSIPCLQGICGSAFAYARNFIPAEGEWYMSARAIQDPIRFMFNAFDSIFVATVSNWLRGIELKPLNAKIDIDSDIIDVKNEKMKLVDAGIAFNSPYPPVLHPSREVDIIISFDFSQRDHDFSWPFEELEKAETWAKKRHVPFPELKTQLENIKKDWKNKRYQEVYVFQGDKSKKEPTIVHFVLINKYHFDTDEKDNGKRKYAFRIFPKNYNTIKFAYSAVEIDRLQLLIYRNVLKNILKIDECIFSAIDRKQKVQNERNKNKQILPGEKKIIP